MAAPQGLIRFAGINKVVDFELTYTQGVTPSVINLRVSPQSQLKSLQGDVEILYGRNRIVLKDCHVHSPSIQRQGAFVVSLRIFDRRWRWRYGHISGHYNVRVGQGRDAKIKKGTEKDSHELARMLLDAMKEQGADVTALPKSVKPEVHWEYDNPAAALEALCHQLGCRVVLQHKTNKVKICKVGQGGRLPREKAMNGGYGLSTELVPDSMMLVGGYTLYQSKFKLEAVGLDGRIQYIGGQPVLVGHEIKPINKLSYRPTDGWENSHPMHFVSVQQGSNRKEVDLWRKTALQTVFRWYRIAHQSHKPAESQDRFAPPGYRGREDHGPVFFRDQILPLRSTLLETYKDGEEIRELPAMVDGVFWTENSDKDTETGTIYEDSFSIDGERGIVQFDKPVVRLRVPGENKNRSNPAELYLTTSYAVKHFDDNTTERFTYERSGSGKKKNTEPFIVRQDDIVRKVRAIYAGQNLFDTVDNADEMIREARVILEAASSRFIPDKSLELEYAGFYNIDLDGRINQVSWALRGGKAVTRASINKEHDRRIPTFEERRNIVQARQQEEMFLAMRRATRK